MGEQTGAHFKPTRKFDIKVELGMGIGAHNEEERREVRVRFDAEVATYILERKWHDTAVKTQNADGTGGGTDAGLSLTRTGART